uniref:Uncharacterized protein n=1 Tax=Cairina moschata TaxID=8855 RepID=A0A8C3GEB9_CAIMO
MEAARGRPGLLLLLLLLPPLAAALLGPAAAPQLGQETIRVDVMMLKSNGEFHKGQVVFNITYANGQVYLNDFPMKSGVAHITCQTVILENGSLGNPADQQRLGTVSVPYFILTLNSVNLNTVCLPLLQVQQEEVTEIDILVKDLRVLRHSNYTVPLKESMLYSIPRDNDVLFTLPNLSGKGISLISTSSSKQKLQWMKRRYLASYQRPLLG